MSEPGRGRKAMRDSRGRRVCGILGVFAAVLLGGCHNCLNNPRLRMSFDFAKRYYDSRNFEEARKLYAMTLEMCPDFYEGMLGLANACREHGNQLFAGAHELVIQKKPDQAKKFHQQAKEDHSQALAWFQKTMELNPQDERPHYGLGLFFYQRATSPVPYPYSLGDKNRQKERDLAIQEFEVCLKKVPTSYQAHRYMSLSLFTAGRTEEARGHLVAYHDFVQRTYDRILDTWPSSAEEDKKRKEAALKGLDQEVNEVRDVLLIYRDDLGRRKGQLELRKEVLKPEETQELARVSRELLQMEDVIRGFSVSGTDPVRMALRERCLEFLKCLNRGSLPECLTFVTGKPEEEAALRQRLQGLIGQGTRYEKAVFRTITVDGDIGVVGIACDRVTRSGTEMGVEAAIRWKMVSGLWRVSALP